jgi:hypothetical protein
MCMSVAASLYIIPLLSGIQETNVEGGRKRAAGACFSVTMTEARLCMLCTAVRHAADGQDTRFRLHPTSSWHVMADAVSIVGVGVGVDPKVKHASKRQVRRQAQQRASETTRGERGQETQVGTIMSKLERTTAWHRGRSCPPSVRVLCLAAPRNLRLWTLCIHVIHL